MYEFTRFTKVVTLFTIFLSTSFVRAEDRVIVTASKDARLVDQLPQSVSKIDENQWNQAGGILEQIAATIC